VHSPLASSIGTLLDILLMKAKYKQNSQQSDTRVLHHNDPF